MSFWAWWTSRRDDVAAAIDGDGMPDELIDELREHVAAIDPQLDWELAPGTDAEHALVVTSGGNPDLRATAERWRRSAPPADATWEYHAARPPSYGDAAPVLDIDGQRIDLAELSASFAIDDDREEVDVVVHHPRFAEIGEQTAGRVTFLALDWMLGEEGVKRWIGAIDVAPLPPPAAGPLRTIVDAVHELEHSTGEDRWLLLGGEDDEGVPIMVSAARPLKPVEHPLLDTHVSLTLAYEGREDGLPTPEELDTLRAFEDDLEGELHDDAFFVAHASHAGERTFHLYVDGETDAADRLRRWASDHGAAFDAERDAAWDAVRAYR